jgi:DNA-binding protein H-NS
MATYAQLKKQIDQLNKQADAARQIEKGATLTKVREAVAAFELTVEEVFGTAAAKSGKPKASKAAAPKRRPKGAGQAKYRHPKSGAEWSGFGRAPAWLASVKDRTKFLIGQEPVAEVNPAEKAVSKTAKKAIAKKATPSPKAQPAAKKAVKAVVATAAKKVAPVTPKATVKTPAKKAVKVVTPKAPAKASRKHAVKATPVTSPAAAPEVATQEAAPV